MTIECDIEEEEIEDSEGVMVPGVIATCSECGHSTQSFGTGESSIKRCLVLMRKNCPNREQNFYVSRHDA